MLLQNYWSWQKAMSKHISAVYQRTFTFNPPVVDIDGNSISTGDNGTNYNSNCQNYANLEMRFGTSNTSPDVTNYSLGNDVTSDLTISQSYEVTCSSTNLKFIFSVSINNPTANDITIKEIGITKYFNTGAYVSGKRILLIHNILDTPITIAAGASKSIEYEWVMQ